MTNIRRGSLALARRGVHRALWALLIPLAAAGCWPARGYISDSDIRPLPFGRTVGAKPEPIRGLRAALDASPDLPVRVLVVHGMRTRNAEYSELLQRGIARNRLRLVADTARPVLELERGYRVQIAAAAQPQDSIDVPPSQLRRRAWLDPVSKRERLVFYELLWAPTRDAVKDRFLACFESGLPQERCARTPARRNEDRRGIINDYLKDNLLVDGFGDATTVLGSTGDLLRDDVDLALCTLASEVAARRDLVRADAPRSRCEFQPARLALTPDEASTRLAQAQVFVVTHSLGSFLVMDAHQRYALAAAQADTSYTPDVNCPPEPQAESLVSGTARTGSLVAANASALQTLLDRATVFMRANQVSLLGLARLEPQCYGFDGFGQPGGACPNRALKVSGCGSTNVGPFGGTSQYVAFNDAADLLGFELPPYLGGVEPFGTLVNVSVRNPHKWSIPPFFRNPGDIHNRSDENPAILNAIVNGLTIPLERRSTR
jgi:hypothetical protein